MISHPDTPTMTSRFHCATFLLMLLVVVLSLGCAPANSLRNMSQLNTIAGSLKQAGSSPEIVAQLNTYLQNYPQDDLAWSILGNCHRDLGNLPAATSAFDTALQINPNLVEAITGQGILLRQQGRYDESLAMYQKALQIDPNYAQAYASMVAIAIFQKDYAKAVQYGEQSYRLDSADPVIAANLAIAYHYLGDFPNRDKFKNIAAELNYKSMDSLQQIIDAKAVVGQ
jgi:tetratricopeptide (TPR) repeat protein